jgi:carnitine O-palmitoyltransferase 2
LNDIVLDEEIRQLDKESGKNSNYISESWFDMYLRDRRSVVLNHNPFIGFTPHTDKSLMTQALRATNFLVASARFAKSLRANKLKPEIFHLDPAKSETTTFERLMK